MKIVETSAWNRRDFRATYQCEGCGHKEEGHGYDDCNFHENVIPDMKCKDCGKSRKDLGIETTPTVLRYKEWEII